MSGYDEKSLYQYDVFPKIIIKNKKTKITVKPKLKLPFDDGKKYVVQVLGMMQRDYREYLLCPENGSIVFEHKFEYEQEYSVKIYASDVVPDNHKKYSYVYLYCVEEDLYKLRPFKGDFHLHSQRSDGRESPAGVCAAARKAGLDFWALTDHFRYLPSIEAIDAYKDVKLGAKIFPGEEIHFHGLGHIIAFGGDYGLGEKYSSDEYRQEYEKELTQTRAKTKGDFSKLPGCLSEDDYVKWMHAVDMVKKTNAITVMVHPFWVEGENKYHYSDEIADFFMQERYFDAFELLNGDYGDSNSLQIALWQEQRGKGNYVPLVSGTDAHTVIGDGFFARFFTVVFAPDMELESIKQAIGDEKTVVISTLIESEYRYKGGSPLVYGHFRFAAFSLYLMRQIFPLHDELCFEEGRLMAQYISGEDDAGTRLNAISCGTKKLYDKLWGV